MSHADNEESSGEDLHSQILDRIQQTADHKLQQHLLYALALYLTVPFYRIFATSVAGPAMWALGGQALLLIEFWACLRFLPSARTYVHQIGTLAGLTIACGIWGDLYWTGSSQTLPMTLLLLGTAAFFTKALWLTVVWMPMLSGWTWYAYLNLRPSDFRFSLGVLGLVAAAAAVGFWLRHQQRLERTARLIDREVENQREAEIFARFERAVEGTQDGLWHWDLEKKILQLSPTWELLLGYMPGELSSSPEEWFQRVHPGYLASLHKALNDHLEGKTQQFRHEHRIQRQDGTYLWVVARGTAIRSASGKAVAIAGGHSDISALIKVEKSIYDEAFQDKLTSLPNRHMFMAQLGTAISELRRTQGRERSQFAVLFLDLNKFKKVNDTLGHLIGDQLLIAAAGRLKSCTSRKDIVSRFAGDEFVVLLTQIRRPEEAINTARRIAGSLSEPYNLDGQVVHSGGSIGIALSAEDFKDGEELVGFADAAMYEAKALPPSTSPKDRVALYRSGTTKTAENSRELADELSRAVSNQALELHYQPCLSLKTGRIEGVEALIRWRRMHGGLLAPSEFIPIAEKTGLIHQIGEWALETACRQAADWQRAGLPPVKMAVNLSARQLEHADFSDTVKRVLQESRLDSKWLELELTETALIDSIQHAPETLAQLAALGIDTAIDDFGTGYSSLNYLRRFDFKTLKMDRCFVSDITSDHRAAAVARGLITMAHELNLAVVAEGVERRDQLDFLSQQQCDRMQGFLASRPLPAAELNHLLHVDILKLPHLETPAQQAVAAHFKDNLTKLTMTR